MTIKTQSNFLAVALVLPLCMLSFTTPAHARPDNRPAMPVQERNVDETGAIRVRQQGVLEVEIDNLPTTTAGALRVQIEGSDPTLEVSGTVGLDPSANSVTVDPGIREALEAIEDSLSLIKLSVNLLDFDDASNLKVVTPATPQAGLPFLSLRNPLPLGVMATGPADTIFNCADGLVFRAPEQTLALVTGVTFGLQQRDAVMQFRRDGSVVHVLAAKRGEVVNHVFPHPLLVDQARILGRNTTDGQCSGIWFVTGQSISQEEL